MSSTLRWFAAVALLAVLPLCLRTVPIAHGLPRVYVPDTHMVKNALGMARDRDLVPPVGKYSSYPYLMPYLLLPVYAAEYAVGRATGRWNSGPEFGMRAMHDPTWAELPARLLVALLGAATAWAVFRAAREAGQRGGAWIAAFLVATSTLNVQLSTHERPWVPLVFFGALCTWAAIRHARAGSGRALLACGALGALAFACHQAGLIFLGLAGLAWLLGPRGWSGADLAARLRQGVACVALFTALALVLGHPYYLRYGLVPQDAVVGAEQASEHFSIGGQALPLGLSLDSFRHLSSAMLGYDLPLLALGLCGIVAALRSSALRAVAWFTIAVALFFAFNPSDHIRYLLPVGMLLALPAGGIAERWFARSAGRLVVVGLCTLSLVQACRLSWVLSRPDSRALAEARLAELPAGSLVAIDHYGPAVDLDRASLERLLELRGELRTREAFRYELLKADALTSAEYGLSAIAIEELCEYDPVSGDYVVREKLRHLGASPPEVLGALGVTHFLLVDRRPSGHEPRPLAEWAATKRTLWELSPAPNAAPPRECFLPTEMDFPLTGLWQVERPGPWMRLVEL